MPHYIICVDEGIFLSESRHEAVWLAVTELASELLPEKAKLLRGWRRQHIATASESSAWLEAYFKVRNYKPPNLSIDLRKYHTPIGYDTKGLAKELGMKPESVAILLRKCEKALMLVAAEEVLQAVRHSYQFNHRIKLTKA